MITSNANVGFIREVQMKLKRLNIQQHHPFLDAKPAQNGNYKLGIYNELADVEISKLLYKDLESFITNQYEKDASYTSFVAVFAKPSNTLDAQFAKLLSNQLFTLQQLNKRPYEIQKAIKLHPEQAACSFNLVSRNFYVIGMHSKSNRNSRRFDYPLLAFYPSKREVSWKIPEGL